MISFIDISKGKEGDSKSVEGESEPGTMEARCRKQTEHHSQTDS